MQSYKFFHNRLKSHGTAAIRYARVLPAASPDVYKRQPQQDWQKIPLHNIHIFLINKRLIATGRNN